MTAPAMQATLGGRRRVLVVDDSRAMLAIIRRVLESRSLGPLEIETVASGEQALDAVERCTPSLVLSDWHMPGMTGMELLQTLRQLGHSELTVGFVTTETTPALLEQALTNGAAFIVHKPFNDHELLAAVSGVLTGARPNPAGGPGSGQPLPDPANGVRALRRFVQAWMPGVPFRVADAEPQGSDHLTAQNLLAEYTVQAGGGLRALAVANLPALCMLGGGAIQDGRPTAAIVDSAVAFFRDFAPQLASQLGVADAGFKDATLVPRDFAGLRAAVDGTGARAAYRLSVPGYGDGRLLFIRS
jgi:CheY-like chemotaxis protein